MSATLFRREQFSFASSDSQLEDLKAIASVLPSSAVTYLNGESALKNLPEQAKGKTVIHVVDKLELSPEAIDTVLGGCQSSCDLLVISGTQAEKWNSQNYGKMAPVNIVAQKCQCLGARNVVISLWRRPLNEAKTQWQEFYGSILAGLNPAALCAKPSRL